MSPTGRNATADNPGETSSDAQDFSGARVSREPSAGNADPPGGSEGFGKSGSLPTDRRNGNSQLREVSDIAAANWVNSGVIAGLFICMGARERFNCLGRTIAALVLIK